MLDRVDVHCIWVSSAVLELLPSPFPNIPGGEVITVPGPGVFCDNAQDLVIEHWPKPSKTQKTEFIREAQKSLNGLGLVGMHDAGVAPMDVELFEELAETGDWSLRMYAMRECERRNTFCGNDVAMIERTDGMLTVKSVKLFAGESVVYN
jgi:predicted amidohydrolase YtcJ